MAMQKCLSGKKSFLLGASSLKHNAPHVRIRKARTKVVMFIQQYDDSEAGVYLS